MEPIFDQQDVNNNKLMAVLCYFGLLIIIPVVARPNSQFIKFHSNQGLVLFITYIVAGLVTAIPFLGWVAGPLMAIFCVVCWFIGVFNALSGKAKRLPLIGKYNIIQE